MTEDRIRRGSEIVRRLFSAALAAVEPESAVRERLAYHDETLFVGAASVPAPAGVHVVAVGKAAVAMSNGAWEALDGAIISGDVIAKDGHADSPLPAPLRVSEASHPIPDQRGVDATGRALEALQGVPPRAVVLALISGGGSALLEAPTAGLSLSDLAATTDLLLRAGAPIDALNGVRSPLSRVKAGGLRAAAPNLPWVTLILSDVLGNDPRVIASGPTVPGGSDPGIALGIIDRFGVRDAVPESVITVLEKMPLPDMPSTHDDILLIIGDNASAVRAASDEAHRLGLEAQTVWTGAEGEAAELGRGFTEILCNARPSTAVVLGGGEATVTVRGNGRGGRNTEFALAAAIELDRRGMLEWVVGSLGTDGQDAMTGLAGAIADAGTANRARAAGINPIEALRHNDSQSVFEATGGAVETGPTGTNVNDLYIAVRVAGSHREGAAQGD